MRRDDLLALDEAKLAELATRGHVKRAVKDLAAGRGPTLTVEGDGTVVAVTDDATVRLGPGLALRDAPCTCPAPKVCAHRVMAVLAYRAAHAGAPEDAPAAARPAAFDDGALEAFVGRAAFRRASERRRKGYVAQVGRGEVPSVELATCTVRFLVAGELGYARCDCRVGLKCEHVPLAVWACREADARHPLDAPSVTVEIGADPGADDDGAAAALAPALELARELLLDGAVGAGAAIGARLARARKPLEDAKLLWPRTILEDLEETLASYAGRAASYRPERVGELSTELFARARAASRDGAIPPRAVLGRDEAEETALEHTRLVGLGARLSIEPGADGERLRADVFLADPDTGAVLVLRAAWPFFAGDDAAAIARRHVAPGVPLGALARGQLVTQLARRRANQELRLGAGRRGLARTSVTPQRGDLDALAAPLFVDDYAALAGALRDAPPRCLRPRLLADRVRALAVHEITDVGYDPATQTLSATLHDGRGGEARLALAHARAAPRALDALSDALDGPIRFVTAEVWREGVVLCASPIAVVTDRVVALDLEAPSRASSLAVGVEAAPADPLHERLGSARALLDRGAHAGLRHVTEAWRDEVGREADRLRDVALTGCAARLRDLADRLAARSSVDGDEAIAMAWLDASLRVRLALETG